MLLCAAIELDTRIAGLCARAQQDPNRTYPTFALVLALFDEPAWDVLSPERPLRYWRLIEINQPGAQPLTTSPLRADVRTLRGKMQILSAARTNKETLVLMIAFAKQVKAKHDELAKSASEAATAAEAGSPQ